MNIEYWGIFYGKDSLNGLYRRVMFLLEDYCKVGFEKTDND